MLTDLTYLPGLTIDVKFESIFLEFQSEGINFKTFEKKELHIILKCLNFTLYALIHMIYFRFRRGTLWRFLSCGNFHLVVRIPIIQTGPNQLSLDTNARE